MRGQDGDSKREKGYRGEEMERAGDGVGTENSDGGTRGCRMRFRGLKKKEAGDGTERWGPRAANQGPGRTGQGLGETRMKGREGESWRWLGRRLGAKEVQPAGK